MKKVIVILLTSFAINSSIAETSALPTYEQAEKLAAAAWKSPPRSIDITYYSTLKDNTKTEENLRQFYKDVFDKEYGPDDELSPEVLERKELDIQSNVENELAEQQQGGKKVKYRIRCDGNSYRIDRVDGRPEMTIRKGTALEQFRPGTRLDADTPFDRSLIETTTAAGGFERYTYFHGLKVAEIEKIDRVLTAIENRKIINVLRIPHALILQMKLGTRKNNVVSEPYDINEAKIKKLCSGTLEGFKVEIRPDPNEPEAKDRIEISLYNNDNVQTYTSLMIYAKDDYSKVYYCQTPNPAVNKSPTFIKTCSDFDAQGIPHNVTAVQYEGTENVRLHETYHIENIRVNTTIAKEVFEFNPPEDYSVTDYRLSEAERLAAKIENMKKRLKDEDSGRRLQALMSLIEYFKDDTAELKDIATSMLKDQRDDIRRVSLHVLTRVLKDNPEELKKIAVSMQDDEDPMVKRMVEKILQQGEPNK